MSRRLCPYKGLAAFEGSDAAYFYGRERVVGELAARTVGMGMLGVVGPSGSGKSSVVMAGLLPSLAAGLLPGSERWGHAILRPGEHPVDALNSALASGEPGERLVLVVDQFEEVFSTTSRSPSAPPSSTGSSSWPAIPSASSWSSRSAPTTRGTAPSTRSSPSCWPRT